MWKSVLLGITIGIITSVILIYTFWYIATEILTVVIK